LFVGIHPYKGTHPTFKKFDLEGRMKANVSIFNPDVRLPGTVRDLSTIPSNYKDWFVRTFEKGERTLPPGTMGNIIAVAARVASIGSNHFDIDLVAEYESNIYRWKDGYCTLADKILKGRDSFPLNSISAEVIHTTPYHQPLKVWIENGTLNCQMFTGTSYLSDIAAEDKMVSGDSVFIKHGNKLTEYQYVNLGTNVMLTVASSYEVMPNATKLFNQIVYQDVLGLPVFMVFGKGANSGKTACLQYRLNELRGYQILEAKQEGGVVIIVASKAGKFDTITVKMSKVYPEYKLTIEEDTGYHVPNFTVLDNGICVQITPDDEARIFSSSTLTDDVKVIQDPAISFDMKLCHDGMKVMYRRGKKLYKLAIRK
jgi:hypothetical protein